MSQTKEKLRFLVEQRKLLATQNQISTKCLIIAKNLGLPIVRTSHFHNRLQDTWKTDEDWYLDNELPRIDEDDEWIEYELGYSFDGLRFGVNLCIVCLAYDHKVVETRATFNGYVVFAEIEGIIKAYAPFPAWEDRLNMIYEGALEKEKNRVTEERAAKEKEKQRTFAKFWEGFRRLWGY